MDQYSGGGYVVRFKGSSKLIRTNLRTLEDLKWVNNHTRAVFFEFAVYNANINLFGVATLIAEFIPGGGIKPFYRIDPVNLLRHHDPDGGFNTFALLVYSVFVVYFTIKELIRLKQRGFMSYFQDYWSWGEWTIIIAGYLSGGLYLSKFMLTRDILTKFAETKGNIFLPNVLLNALDYVGR